jgi:hypothetical protein
MELADLVGRQVSEIRHGTDVDSPLLVLVEGTYGLAVGDVDQPPRRAVVLEDAACRGHIEHVALVEQQCPVLRARAVFVGRVHAHERPALFGMASEPRRRTLRGPVTCKQKQTDNESEPIRLGQVWDGRFYCRGADVVAQPILWLIGWATRNSSIHRFRL